MAFRIIVGHPQCLRGPRHAQLRVRAIRTFAHVKHARSAPMHQIVGFPDDQVRAAVMRELVPIGSGIGTVSIGEHHQIRGEDVHLAGLRVTHQVWVAHAHRAQRRCQYRLAAVQRIPMLGIIPIGQIEVDSFRIRIRVLDKVDQQIAEWLAFFRFHGFSQCPDSFYIVV